MLTVLPIFTGVLHCACRTTMQIDMRNHRYASEPARMASIYRDVRATLLRRVFRFSSASCAFFELTAYVWLVL